MDLKLKRNDAFFLVVGSRKEPRTPADNDAAAQRYLYRSGTGAHLCSPLNRVWATTTAGEWPPRCGAVSGRQIGEINEFPVPAEYVRDRKIVLTWDQPTDEGHLNWRQKSRVAEVWLIKSSGMAETSKRPLLEGAGR